eukprot:GHVS01109128.1.p1 GENE.GHVS01109128.1~~GHVS01109128.1.p1  ORF type:complete len:193 (+),score=36.31 GHVS01109128.1:119-697(+)
MGNSLSRCDTCIYSMSVAGIVCALTYPNLYSFSWLLRPLLNASWGFLFGSAVWVAVIQRQAVLTHLTPQESCLIGSVIFPPLFKAGTLCSSILFLCTAGLAPNSPLLLRSSLLCYSLSLFNSIYAAPKAISTNKPLVEKEEEALLLSSIPPENLKAAEEELAKMRKEHRYYFCMSRVCGYCSMLALLPYALL